MIVGGKCVWLDHTVPLLCLEIYFIKKTCVNQVNIEIKGLFEPGELLSLLKSVFVRHRFIIFAVDLLSKH